MPKVGPKLSTMELITRLEDSPRGVYCGAIGVIAPGAAGERPRASLSVAIRTVVVDRTDGSAVYGADDAEAAIASLRASAERAAGA